MNVGIADIVNKNSVHAATIATVLLVNVLVAPPVVFQWMNVIVDSAETAAILKETVDALVKRMKKEKKTSSYSRAVLILHLAKIVAKCIAAVVNRFNLILLCSVCICVCVFYCKFFYF